MCGFESLEAREPEQTKIFFIELKSIRKKDITPTRKKIVGFNKHRVIERTPYELFMLSRPATSCSSEMT